MKKLRFLALLFVLLLVAAAFAGCVPDEADPGPEPYISPEYPYGQVFEVRLDLCKTKLIRNGLALGEGNVAVVIKSTEELEAFLVSLVRTDVMYFVDPFLFIRQFEKEHLAYDDEFFARNILVLAGWGSESGSINYSVAALKVSGNKIQIELAKYVPEVGTDDYVHWVLTAEIPKSAFSGSEAEISFEKYPMFRCGNE